jgi:hypothetical protein
MSNKSPLAAIAQPYPYKCWHPEGNDMPVHQIIVIGSQPNPTELTTAKAAVVYMTFSCTRNIYQKAKSATKPSHSDQAPELSVYLEHVTHGSMNIRIQNELTIHTNFVPKKDMTFSLNDAAFNYIPPLPVMSAHSRVTTDVSLYTFIFLALERS